VVELRTLGALDLRNDAGDALEAVMTQPKLAALLVYMASRSGVRNGSPPGRDSFLRRDPLLGHFWPDQTESRARGSLRQMLHTLR